VSQLQRYPDLFISKIVLSDAITVTIRSPAPADVRSARAISFEGWGAERSGWKTRSEPFFPEPRLKRMDRDTTTRKHSHHHILKRFESGRIDIWSAPDDRQGTRFPGVTLVGVISADTSLHFPDFRSSERTFQLLTQVAGRAGRGEFAGRVIIQTFNPDHYSILRAKEHDFLGFYARKFSSGRPWTIPLLQAHQLPTLRKQREENGESRRGNGKNRTGSAQKGYGKGIQILGPSIAPFARVRGKYRWQMLVKGKNSSLLHHFGRDLSGRLEPQTKGRGVSLDIDVDPVFIL